MAEETTDKLIDDPTPLSSRMNWPLLSSREPNIDLQGVSATPCSNMLNLPLLSQRQSSSTSVKTEDPTPFSSRFNWPLLSARGSNTELSTDNPTPLSSALNLPLLSDRSTYAATDRPHGTGMASDGPFAKFIRQIITGEVQK